MKNRIFTAIMLAMMLAVMAVSAEAATYRTRLNLSITDSHGGKLSHEVSADLLNEQGIFTGSSKDVRTETDSLGRSVTRTVTEFRNVDGELLMSADVVITTRSDDFRVSTDKALSETISVDVTIQRFDDAYDAYKYSMDIAGLPEWLKAEGELVSYDVLTTDITIYHHEFTISGTATAADKTGSAFTAIVLVSGDTPPMMAQSRKEINITVEANETPPPQEPPDTEPPDSGPPDDPPQSPDVVPKSPDVSPDIEPNPPDVVPKSPDVSPDIRPNPPDVVPKSPDVSPDIRPNPPDVPPESQDISPDIRPSPPDDPPESQDVSPDIRPSPPDKVPDTSQDISPDVEPNPPDNPPREIKIDEDGHLDTEYPDNPAESISEILGSLTQEQIDSVKSIKIDGNIADLSGIEAFRNLEELDLSQAGNLKSADLRGLTNLKSLDVAGNTAIKSLNLSGTGIESLSTEGCAGLEELDVSGCKSLTVLDVSDTPLKTLNAEDCTSLEVLDCSNCRLEELHITGCASLNVIDCSNNRLHKFDAYAFRMLDVLLCSNQNITGWRLGRIFSFMDYFVMHISAADDVSIPESGLENITDIRAWDADGNELKVRYDSATGWAEFSGVPAKMTYDYVTGFEDVLMDVTVFAAEYEDSDPIDLGDHSCGGCNSGFAFSASGMALALLLFGRKRRL